MKTLPLLIEPDIAWCQAKHQTASALRIAVIRRGINIEPDILHVREITAQLADHLVAGAFGAEPGAFHHFRRLKLSAVRDAHVAFRIESSRSGHDALAVNLDAFVLTICRCHATDSAILYE